jgi:hypothetical protein
LVAASTQDPTRRLLGLPENYGPLTLHSISNGLETNYNSWDPLTVLGENGRLGTNPLIIKSKNDASQGIVHSLTVGDESIPKKTSSFKSSIYIRNDGIDIDTEHLERSELVQKLINLVHSYSIVL